MDGGFFLVTQSEFKGAMGKGTETSYMGYDNDDKMYTYDSFNTLGEADHAKGNVDGDTWTWHSETRMGPQTTKGRLTIKMLSRPPPTTLSSKCRPMAPHGTRYWKAKTRRNRQPLATSDLEHPVGLTSSRSVVEGHAPSTSIIP
jgi:hypothetical protein